MQKIIFCAIFCVIFIANLVELRNFDGELKLQILNLDKKLTGFEDKSQQFRLKNSTREISQKSERKFLEEILINHINDVSESSKFFCTHSKDENDDTFLTVVKRCVVRFPHGSSC
jgi:hypothetical protein